jgi:hypothetical protein
MNLVDQTRCSMWSVESVRRGAFFWISAVSLAVGLQVLLLSAGVETGAVGFFHRTDGGVYYFLDVIPSGVRFERSVEELFSSQISLKFISWGYDYPRAISDRRPRSSVWGRIGFWEGTVSRYVPQNDAGCVCHAWTIPLWLVEGLLAVMPAVAVGLVVRQTTRNFKGQCLRCGYDLRATPDRCPECGAVPSKRRI